MIGQSEKSGIEIESEYQLTGHPVYDLDLDLCVMQHIHHLVDHVRTAIFDRKLAVQGIAFHPEFTFNQFLAYAICIPQF